VFVEASPKWPELLVGVFRVSLVDASAGKTYPLRREWMTVEKAERALAASAAAAGGTGRLGAVQGTRVATQGANESGVDKKDAADSSLEAAPRWRLLGRTSQADVYENARALPRAWLASEARALGEGATLEVIRKGRLPEGASWEPRRTALVESEPAERTGVGASEGGATEGGAEVTRYEPNRVDVRTKAGAPSILVLSENHYPGWRAYLDGRSVGVLRVNYAQRGVYVPAGEHEVRFVYRPKSVYFGLLVSLLASAALVAWWLRLLPEERALRSVSRVVTHARGARKRVGDL